MGSAIIVFLKTLESESHSIGERIVISAYFQVYYFQFPSVLPVTRAIKWSQKMKNRDGLMLVLREELTFPLFGSTFPVVNKYRVTEEDS